MSGTAQNPESSEVTGSLSSHSAPNQVIGEHNDSIDSTEVNIEYLDRSPSIESYDHQMESNNDKSSIAQENSGASMLSLPCVDPVVTTHQSKIFDSNLKNSLSNVLSESRLEVALSSDAGDHRMSLNRDSTILLNSNNSVPVVYNQASISPMQPGNYPVVVEPNVNNMYTASSSDINSDYFVVVENADGSHSFSRIVAGNLLLQPDSKDLSGISSSLSNAQDSIGSAIASVSEPEQFPHQSITVVLDDTTAQIDPQNVVLESNAIHNHQTGISSEAESIASSSSATEMLVYGQNLKGINTVSMVDISNPNGTYDGCQSNEQDTCNTISMQGAEAQLSHVGNSVGQQQYLMKEATSEEMDRVTVLVHLDDSNIVPGPNNEKEEEKEKIKQQRLVAEQRTLMQSHLLHHVQVTKKKQGVVWQKEEESDDSIDMAEHSVHEAIPLPSDVLQLEKSESFENTPVFNDITATINSNFKDIPGCQQFLLNLAQHRFRSDLCYDQVWTFKGTLSSLLALHRILESYLKLKTKGAIPYEKLVSGESREDKSVTCNLLVPYVSSKGRRLTQSNRITGMGFVHFPDTLELDELLDRHDTDYVITSSPRSKTSRRRKQKVPKKSEQNRMEPKIIRPVSIDKSDLQNVPEEKSSSRAIDCNNDNLIDKVGKNTDIQEEESSEIMNKCESVEVSGIDLSDPLQHRLREEQIKCKKIMDNKLKHYNLKRGPNLDTNITEESKGGCDLDEDSQQVECSEDSSVALLEDPLRRKKGRPRKKYDPHVTVEKMKPRNPLTESAATKQQRNYEEHMAFKFFCTECSFKSKRQSHFLSHMRCHKDGSVKKYCCHQCEFVSISLTMLKRHELKHKKNVVRCELCAAYTTDRQELMQRHMRLKHGSTTAVPGSSLAKVQLQCVLCQFCCSSPQGLAKHMRKHAESEEKYADQEDGSHSCSQCEKTFRHRMHLHRHMRDVHGPEVRPHLCDKCGKAFKRTDALQQHRLVHVARSARQLPFKCSSCSKGFRSAAHLKEHMSMHSSERPFLCQYCGAAFKTQPVQKKHIMTLHIKPRTHVCAVCCRQFNTKNALQRHESTHNKLDATEVAVAEMQKSEEKMRQEPTTGLPTLTVGQTATITVNGQPATCLVQDLINTVAAVDQSGQNFIQGNQGPQAFYYFTEELQTL